MQTKSFLPKFLSIIAFLAALLVVSPQDVALAASQTHNAGTKSHVASSAIAPKVAVRPLDAAGCWNVVNNLDCTGLDPYGNNGWQHPVSPNCTQDQQVVGAPNNQYGSTIYIGSPTNTPYVRIDLMWSPHCMSNWTDMTCLNCPGAVGLQTRIIRKSGQYPAIDWVSNGGADSFENSVMVFAPNQQAQACGMVQFTDGLYHCGNPV